MRSSTSAGLPPCVLPTAKGWVLRVSVVPSARRTGVAGLHDGRLRVRLTAPASEGRANDELVAWLAEQLGIAKRDVVLQRGAHARRKDILLCRLDETMLLAWVGALLRAHPVPI